MEHLAGALRGLSEAMRAKILESACGKAAMPIKRAAVGFAPQRTGALKASIAIKTISDKIGGRAAALVGPAREYFRGGKRLKKGADRRGADRPANYAHLVEYGHIKVRPENGKTRRKKTATVVGMVAPRPFMRPAIVSAASQVAAILHNEISVACERERIRLVGKT